MENTTKTFISDVSGNEFPITERVSGKSIRESVLKFIQKINPNFTSDNFMSSSELNNFRTRYITEAIGKQIGNVTDLEKTVLTSLSDNTTLSAKIEDGDDLASTFGQRLADNVASFGGSWKFIITFGTFLFIWILLNILLFAYKKAFDPYPFILLNLILSCLAAIQAPVIMMSQNRRETKDRERSKKDYMVNLKSELEIRNLHEKMDHLIIHQQQELMEVQNVQIEMLNDILIHIEQKDT